MRRRKIKGPGARSVAKRKGAERRAKQTSIRSGGSLKKKLGNGKSSGKIQTMQTMGPDSLKGKQGNKKYVGSLKKTAAKQGVKSGGGKIQSAATMGPSSLRKPAIGGGGGGGPIRGDRKSAAPKRSMRPSPRQTAIRSGSSAQTPAARPKFSGGLKMAVRKR